MEKPSFPSWRVLSSGSKIWLTSFLFGPPFIVLFMIELARYAYKWVFASFIACVLGLLLYVGYMSFMWISDHKGFDWLWHAQLFAKRILVLLAGNRGEMWLNWAMNTKDDRMARAMLKLSAKCQYPDGLYEWGRVCKNEKKTSAAADAFLNAAHLGHVLSAWEMGEAMRLGLYYMPLDPAQARTWHEVAARAGHLPSIRVLAIGLETGAGFKVDGLGAHKWQKHLQNVLRRSVPDGESQQGMEATAIIGQNTSRFKVSSKVESRSHEAGRIDRGRERRNASSFYGSLLFIRDLTRTIALRAPRREINRVISFFIWIFLMALLMYNMYLILAHAILYAIAGIPIILALMWMYYLTYNPYREIDALRKRADKGEVEALYEMGMVYRNGSAYVWPDMAIARQWLLQAAEKDHHEAMLQYGQLLAEGKGGEIDLPQATLWLERAKNAGNAEAYTLLSRISSKWNMDGEQKPEMPAQ